MKFYLQDCQTSEFMRCDSSWGADINEALDFLSERRAFFFGMKELKNPFQILKVVPEAAPLPAFIPQLVLFGGSRVHFASPVRATNCIDERVPLMRGLQNSVLGLSKRLSGLGEISRLNLF